jgi:hypothetical protein
MNGPRRLRVIGAQGAQGAQPHLDLRPHQLSPVRVRAGSIAIAECVEDAGAHTFAQHLAEALRERGMTPFLAFCAFDTLPHLATAQAARLRESAPHWVTVRIAGQPELQELVGESERAVAATPCLFVGEPALIGLEGALKVVIDREGAPASLTPRARQLRAIAHLVLSAPRAGVARLLADGWHLPRPAH